MLASSPSGYRTVRGLVSARAIERPSNIPVSQPRGAKAAGLRYERALARMLPGATHGQWWEFWDANGRGVCQTDLFLTVGDAVVVVEVKYTWTLVGHGQLENLYLPVLRKATGREVIGLVACKKLVPEVLGVAQVSGNFVEALEAARSARSVLHVVDPKPLRRAARPRLSTAPGAWGVV